MILYLLAVFKVFKVTHQNTLTKQNLLEINEARWCSTSGLSDLPRSSKRRHFHPLLCEIMFPDGRPAATASSRKV